MLHFSEKTNWQITPNDLSRELEILRQRGQDVIDLTISNPSRCDFQYLNSGLLDPLLKTQNLIYEPDPHGLRSARETVCHYYAQKGIELSPDQIFLTAGTSEAYSFLFRLLGNPRDHLIVPQPSYPLIDYVASLNDLSIKRYSLTKEDSSWTIDFGTLSPILTVSNPCAVLLVNPNNPTGNYATDGENLRLQELLAPSEIPLISDEVFLDFEIESSGRCHSLSGNSEILTFTLSGISKILGLPQMKLSWIIVNGPEEIRREAIKRLEIIADTYLSVSTPIQNALPDWFSKQSDITGEILQRVQTNLACVKEKARDCSSFRFYPPQGGWSFVLEMPGSKSDEEWAIQLLTQDHVLSHPGYLFDFPEGSFLVISLITPPATFQEGLDRMLKRLKRIRGSLIDAEQLMS